jgi:outer membrane receptor protein involved in Fe transport
MCSAPAFAQEQEQAVAKSDEPVSDIVVTGSRIRSDGMQAPTPVTVVNAEALETLSPGPIIAGISQLPQFYGNQTPNSGANFFSRSGYGALNLRGLGVNRTLTLLNGRRMPSSTAFGGVDVNMFPEAMISSVETATGGASAAYGSDAVAGVVNFMLDTKFTGIQLDLQGGITDRGDNEQFEVSASYGVKIGDRGHLLISAEYSDQKGVFNYKGRNWYEAWSTMGAGTAASPYRFLPNVISSNGSFDGIIISPNAAISGLSFDSRGNVVPFNRGSETRGNLGAPGSRHVAGPTISGDDLGAEVATLYPDLDRYAVFAYGDYEVSDSVKLFAQYLRGQTHTFQYSTPSSPRGGFLGQPTTLTIYSDNAYLPESLKTTMAANNIASFTLRRTGTLADVGQMSYDDTTTQNVVTAGFEAELKTGGLFDGWNVDGYYQYGHSKRDWRQLGLRVDRVFAAVDAVRDQNGNIVCRVSTFVAGAAAFPGCQPINLFGRGGGSSPTPAGYDYVVGFEPGQEITAPIYFADSGFQRGETESFTTRETKDTFTTFTQNYAELSASGDLLQAWAGPVSLALGGSWRRDHIRQIVHDVTNPSSNHTNPSPKPVLCNNPALGLRGVSGPDCANTVGNQYSKVSNILGTSEVWEAFGEVLMPLVDTDDFSITANGAVRWANYSGSGTVWAYKGGLATALLDNAIRLRGTYSRDVRAGNLSERFDKTGGIASVTDPRYPSDGVVSVTRFSGGNPSVRPEKADTMTLGMVLKPAFAPNLSASVNAGIKRGQPPV